jgi:hypothetical protein
LEENDVGSGAETTEWVLDPTAAGASNRFRVYRIELLE